MKSSIVIVTLISSFAFSVNASMLVDSFEQSQFQVFDGMAVTSDPLGSTSQFANTRFIAVDTNDNDQTDHIGVTGGLMQIDTLDGTSDYMDGAVRWENFGGVDFTGTENAANFVYDAFVLSIASSARTADSAFASLSLVVNGVQASVAYGGQFEVVWSHSLFGDITNVTEIELLTGIDHGIEIIVDSLDSYGSEYTGNGDSQPNPVPEPSTLVILALGLVGVMGNYRKNKAYI